MRNGILSQWGGGDSELRWGAGELDLDFGVAEDSGRQRSQGLQCRRKREAWADPRGLEGMGPAQAARCRAVGLAVGRLGAWNAMGRRRQEPTEEGQRSLTQHGASKSVLVLGAHPQPRGGVTAVEEQRTWL